MNHLDTDWSESSSGDRARLLIIIGIVLIAMLILGALFVGTDGILKMLGLKKNVFETVLSVEVTPDDALLSIDFQQASSPFKEETIWQRGSDHIIEVTHPSFLPVKFILHVPENPAQPISVPATPDNILVGITDATINVQIAMISEYLTKTIESNPSKASVQINGIDTGKVTPFDFEFKLNEPVTVKAQKEGYEPSEITTTIKTGDSSEPVLITLKKKSKPRSPHGEILIQSSYPVSVFESGKQHVKNKTRTTLQLKPGTHTLRIVNEKYQLDQSEVIKVRDKKTHRITIEPPGTVNVNSTPPGAQIIINDTVIGTAPGKYQLSPGLYNVQFVWAQCNDPVSQWVKIVSGQTRNIPMVTGCQ